MGILAPSAKVVATTKVAANVDILPPIPLEALPIADPQVLLNSDPAV